MECETYTKVNEEGIYYKIVTSKPACGNIYLCFIAAWRCTIALNMKNEEVDINNQRGGK
jgi:hypothetical protein